MEVKIELGHKAWKNIKPTLEGYTHDWTVFVQGVNGNEIKHFVEKVIFHLPPSYEDSKRIRKKPPFAISESTSQRISIQIDVFFCTEAKLEKVNYSYDLQIADEVVNISWVRKLTFPNPSKEFKEKLLLAGGEVIGLQKRLPVVTGGLLKCKVEPDDEIKIPNNVDDVTLNASVQKLDNLRNKHGTSKEELLHVRELLEENENLKAANVEIKEKVGKQEKLMVFYEENLSHYETHILDTNKGINQLKKKIEDEEKDISTLKAQLQKLQNELLQITNSSPEYAEEKTRGTKRKNEEDVNISVAVGKGKENVTHPSKFRSSPTRNHSSTSQSSLLRKNTFVSTKNQNICETLKSKSGASSVLNSSQSKAAVELNDRCDASSGNCFLSRPENETQSLNKNSTCMQNLCENRNFDFLDCHKNVSSADTLSFKSTNTCGLQKSIEENSVKADASLKKPNMRNKDFEQSVCGSSMEASLNTPEIIIIDAEKSGKGSLAKASNSLNTPEIIIIDDEESGKGSPAKANNSPRKPEIIIIDDEESGKGSSAKVSDSLNSPEIIIIDAEKSEKGNSPKDNDSLNTPEIIILDGEKSVKEIFNASTSVSTEPSRTNKTRKQLDASGKEHNVSSSKRKKLKSSHSNFQKLSSVGDIASSSLAPSNKKLPEKKRKKKSKKGGKFLEGNTREASASVTTEPETNNSEQLDTHIRKHNISSIKRTNTKTCNSNHKESGRELIYFGDIADSSLTPSNTEPSRKKKTKKWKKHCLPIIRNVFQSETLHTNSICEDSHQSINDTSAPKLIAFMTEHCQKLATELNRIKNSEFSKHREGTNSLFDKLANIDTNPLTAECCKRYLQSLIDYFTDPKTFDMASLIYVVVDYLSRDRVPLESLPTYLENQDVCAFLTPSENCLISALYAVDSRSLPHLNGLVRNTLGIIRRVIISKKNMTVNGLASLCRVLMEICRRSNDRWEPLLLSCELLRLEHPLGPYLINSLAAVWRDPFKLYDKFSEDENMVLGAIMYGMKDKPLLMDEDLWRQTQRIGSTYFPHPFIIDRNQAIEFLTAKIVSRCVEGLFENLWMLASPLVIFVSKETLDWKTQFRNGYILPNLLNFLRCLNEHGFSLFSNLYVDIFSFCHESVYEEILQLFVNSSLHRDTKFIPDCAAIALLKCIGVTDKHISASLRDWFLRNQDHPKLALIVDLYCTKVMASHDSVLLWDDVIIS